jgi:uncharacterized protein YutE (UPF0331/DUF86 family)
MSSYSSSREEAVLETLLPQLEAEGFEVFVHPSRAMLPVFLNTYQPDAIALKGDRKVAIEVTSPTGESQKKVEYLSKLFSEHADWELRIVYAPPRTNDEIIPVASAEVIEEHLVRIEHAFDVMGPASALLTAWAVFEAAARSLIPVDLERPQAPARLLQTLASNGYVTPDEAAMLRRLGQIRNGVAHGRLDITPTREQVEGLIDVTRTLLRLD